MLPSLSVAGVPITLKSNVVSGALLWPKALHSADGNQWHGFRSIFWFFMQIINHPTIRGAFQLTAEQWLPRPLSEVFAFFADAYRLQDLTPPFLNFHVVTPAPIDMYPGTKIDYRLRLRGIPVRWRSEISEWQPPHRFVDRQLIGPYRFWHHLHTFEEQNGGTFVRDTVDYGVPGGKLVHWLVVRRDLEKIFQYRRQRLEEFFGSGTAATRPGSDKASTPQQA